MFDKFKARIKEEEMLAGGETIVAAVSGGIDSMVLLHLLKCYIDEFGGSIIVAHVNHRLRGEDSERDEEFVKFSAAQLDLPFMSRSVDVKTIAIENGLNVHEAARRERYAFFEHVLKKMGGDKLALGHHFDDQAETVLMRLIRGSGIRGLGGIPPARGKIIRPLMSFSRKEIEAFASGNGIAYVEDRSNKDPAYLRNRIRLQLLPILKEYNPRICSELNLLSQINRDVDDYLQSQALASYHDVRLNSEAVDISLNLDLFNATAAPLKPKVILLALEEIDGEKSGFFSVHLLDIVKLALKGKSGSSLNLPRGIRVSLEYGKIIFSKGISSNTAPYSKDLKIPGLTLIEEAGTSLMSEVINPCRAKVMESNEIIRLDMDRIQSPLKVRNYNSGDRIRIKGMKGRKKLKDLFIDEKIPARERRRIPLLVSGEEILWVVGLRAGGSALADDSSMNILQVRKV